MTATLTLSLLTPTMSKYFSDPYITPLALPETKPNTGYKRKALTFRARVHVQSIAITSSEPQTSMITIMSTN